MTFHRLANPSYFIPGGGPLLPGYDLLNDPTTTGGTGIPIVPDPGPKVGGVYDGVYFITSGSDEPANAYNLNRPARAVAESIDILDDRFYQSIAVKTGSVFASVGDATRDLNGSVDNIFTGSSAGNADIYFDVADTLGRPIFVNGARVYVTTSSVAIGSGFSAANPLTLTFSATIPSGLSYIVYYTIRSALTDIPVDSFAQKSVDVSLNTRGYRYDDDVVTVSGGGVSGAAQQHQGDFHGTAITPLLSGTTQRGLISMRPGIYTIDGTQNWTFGARVQNDRLGSTPTIKIDSGRGVDVLITTHLAIRDVALGTASTANYHFIAQSNFLYEGLSSNAVVEAGSLELAGSSTVHHQTLRNLRVQGNTTMLGTVLASLLLTGVSTATIEDSEVTTYPTVAAGLLAYMYINAFTGTAYIRNTVFGGSASGVDGLRINGSTGGRIVFENCTIMHTGTGDAWALRILNSSDIHFKNCKFYSEVGQAIRVDGSGVTFENCTGTSGNDESLSNPQLICGYGAKFINCFAFYGAANVRNNSAPTKAIVELGGIASTPTVGRVEVDGLIVQPSAVDLSSGTGAGISAVDVGFPYKSTVTGLVGMSANSVGKVLRISGATSYGNNGTHVITDYISATSVKVQNLNGSVDASSMTWRYRLGVHNYTTVLLHGSVRTTHDINLYRNVTIDMLGTVPTDLGTFGKFTSTAGGGSVVEVVGGARLLSQSSTAAQATSIDVNSKVTITGLGGMTAEYVGTFLRLDRTGGGGGNVGNNGTWMITDYISATSVKVFIYTGVADPVNYTWEAKGISSAKVKVENLKVLGVGWPLSLDAAVQRGIIYGAYADIDGLVLDGTPYETASNVAAAYAGAPPIKLEDSCDVRDVQIFPSSGLLSINTTAMVMSLSRSTCVRGLRYLNRGVTADTISLSGDPVSNPQGRPSPLFSVDTDCKLVDAVASLDIDVLFDVNTGFVGLTGHRARLENCTFVMEYTGVAALDNVFINVAGDYNLAWSGVAAFEISVLNNTFRWNKNPAGGVSLADFAGAKNSIILGNKSLSVDGTAPAVIPVHATALDSNITGFNANGGNPVVF